MQPLSGLREGLGTLGHPGREAQGQLLLHGGKDDLVFGALKHQAQAVANRHRGIAGWGGKVNLTAVGLIQATEEAKEARFARAVVADQRNARLVQPEVDVTQDPAPTATPIHAAQLRCRARRSEFAHAVQSRLL